jgi:hypothetical protein
VASSRLRSTPGMQWWLFTIEIVFAQDQIFPPHRVVQGVRPGNAPMAVEIVFGEGRAGTGEFEELVGGFDGGFTAC